eukprot:TRINITY_DN47700_c0_g1_i3.p1 TRINITY_DN47700_c0_g1~~TRINITY_DN47700_c0_g1_i3.p1  ORF type:complete len:153 (+),score=14.52 TRINITY_DN47700_c0_g1_i3:269-727(+)
MNYFFNIRPYAIQFLKRLSQFYELIIFSASTEHYITAILNYIDPAHTLISHHLSRNNCYVSPQGYFVKDLRVIPRNQNNMLLIDNLALSYAFNLPNAIPILEWKGDIMDEELNYLADYLEKISNSEDISKVCEEYFRLRDLEKMTKNQLTIY